MTGYDTNILIYCCDSSDLVRQRKAMDLIESRTDGVLLWQVACEFLAASRKLAQQRFTQEDAWNRLKDFRNVLPLILPSSSTLSRAETLVRVHKLSFWDAMIVGACLEANITTLYTEDLPSVHKFETLQIINPFE